MLDDLAAYQLRQLDRIYEIVTPDFMTFAEDMSYNNGPMASRSAATSTPAWRSRGRTPSIPAFRSQGIIFVTSPSESMMTLVPRSRMAGVCHQGCEGIDMDPFAGRQNVRAGFGGDCALPPPARLHIVHSWF